MQKTDSEVTARHRMTPYSDTQTAFLQYERIRHRLPSATFRNSSTTVETVGEITSEFDAFVFDSFGVLNVGETAIPGARDRVEALRRAGKSVLVVTNAATLPLAQLPQKYAALGFEFSSEEILSSREVLSNYLASYPDALQWGVAAPDISRISELPARTHALTANDATFEVADGFIILSSQAWDESLTSRFLNALTKRPRPVLVGNPDLVAPRESGFSIEPGTYGHELADELDVEPEFFGKPFGNVFVEAARWIGRDIDPRRIAMIGDTLHTDILGGAAAGWRTVLVTDHGVMKDLDVAASISSSGIVPDFVDPAI